tara:strand:+ start:860 stop:1261 length:402 start_codon:yes stop_codon:yes gene_type:complete
VQFELTKNEAKNVNETPTTWIKWHEELKEIGDSFQIRADSVSFKDTSAPVFYVVEEGKKKNKGTSVFCAHHPDSKFTDSTPDGVRLANAIGRFFNIEGSVSGSDLASEVAAAENVAVKVEKTEKGRLWSIVQL